MSSQEMHRKHVRAAVLAVIVLALAVIAVMVSSNLENNAYVEKRQDLGEDFSLVPTVEYNGATYAQRMNVTPILLIGYDRTDESTTTGYRSGGQSDFLLLLVIDHDEKTVRQLQIDRDTMTSVTVLGLTGRPTGTRVMQIALSHAFGKTITQNDGYALEAVQNFLEGADIDYTISMNISDISRMNNVLGGVTVTIEDDFTALDPTMKVGATLTLTDQQAEYFCRSRMSVGEGTNVARMRRQQVYMQSAIDLMVGRLKTDSSYANTLLNGVLNIVETNMTRGRLLNELNAAGVYEILPLEVLPGEHMVGSNGYMECHVPENAPAEWVLSAFYRPLTAQ